MPLVKKLSYLLVVLLLAAAVWLRLGPVILAGLFSYMILDVTHRFFSRRLPARLSRWIALLVFLLAATLICWMLVRFVRQTISTLPQIAATAIPKLIALAETNRIDLPFDNVYELREIALTEIRDNADSITKMSGLLTLRIFHVIIAMIAAILCFFSAPINLEEPNLFDTVRREWIERLRTFMLSFEKVLGAQVLISAVNTVLTGCFLLFMEFPHIHFLLIATFILGTLPIIGNILSNTIIVGTALTLSPRHAGFALAFLVVIHKTEYFLNSRIVGSSIKASMWQTLLAILMGEVVMGVPGIILAPALLHYVKTELRSIPVK